MHILSPTEQRRKTRQDQSHAVDAAIALCNEKIAEAMRAEKNKVRVCTGIPYGDSDYVAVDSALETAGYRVDSEVSLRHGHIVDIEWDE